MEDLDRRKELRRLRANFLFDEEVRPGIDLHMIEAAPGHHARMDEPPLKYRPQQDSLTDRGVYGKNESLRENSVHRVWWLTNEHDAEGEHDQLPVARIASMAGDTITGMEIKGVHPESLATGTNIEKWFWTVLDFGLGNKPENPLYTRRYLWGGCGTGQWIKPCDRRFGGLTNLPVKQHPAMHSRQPNGLPAYWYSRLAGLARASVLAIDQILGITTESSGQTGDELNPRVFIDTEIAILTRLAEESKRKRLLYQGDIAQNALVKDAPISKKTVSRYIGKLEKEGYVNRPKGKKNGYLITSLGMKILGK